MLNACFLTPQWSENVRSIWRLHNSLHLKKEEVWGDEGGGGGGRGCWGARDASSESQKGQKGSSNRRWAEWECDKSCGVNNSVYDAQGFFFLIPPCSVVEEEAVEEEPPKKKKKKKDKKAEAEAEEPKEEEEEVAVTEVGIIETLKLALQTWSSVENVFR